MLDGWELEEKLGHVRRILGQASSTGAPHEVTRAPEHRGGNMGRWIWLLDKVAVASQTCAAILLAWSLIASRPDLITPGVSAAVLGLIASLGQRAFSG